MKASNRSHRHAVNHNLRNQVIDGRAARQLKADIVEQRVENDPWYQYNVSRLVAAYRAGKVVQHIFKNVAERLYRIAHHHAQEQVQGF